MCESTSREFFSGAVVHLLGRCSPFGCTEILDATIDGRMWRAVTDNGVVHGVNENTGHVVCGGDTADWVMEKFQPLNHLTSAWGDTPSEILRLLGKHRTEWVRIMNPRLIDHAMMWAKKKKDEGLTVRLRNIRTGDIIMGDIL